MGRHPQPPTEKQRQLGEELVPEVVSEIRAMIAEGQKQPLQPAIAAALKRRIAAPGFDRDHIHNVYFTELLYAEWAKGDKSERARWGIGNKPLESGSQLAAWRSIYGAFRIKCKDLPQGLPSSTPSPVREVAPAESPPLSVAEIAPAESPPLPVAEVAPAESPPLLVAEVAPAESPPLPVVEVAPIGAPQLPAAEAAQPPDRGRSPGSVPSTSEILAPGMHKSIGLTYSASAFVCALQLAMLSETSPEKTRQALPLIAVVAVVTVVFIQISKVVKNYAVQLYDRGYTSLAYGLSQSLAAFGVVWIFGASFLVGEILDNYYVRWLGLGFGLVSSLALVARIVEMDVEIQRLRNPQQPPSWIERSICKYHQWISTIVFEVTIGALVMPLWRCEDQVTRFAIVVTLALAVILRCVALCGARSRSNFRISSSVTA